MTSLLLTDAGAEWLQRRRHPSRSNRPHELRKRGGSRCYDRSRSKANALARATNPSATHRDHGSLAYTYISNKSDVVIDLFSYPNPQSVTDDGATFATSA
jgi:hypothetical protein